MKKNDPLLERRGLIGFILIAIFGIFLSISVGMLMRVWLENEEKSYQNQWGKALGGEVKSEILSAVEVMHTLKNVILSSDSFSKERFEVFVSTTLVRFPALKGIYWVEGESDKKGHLRHHIVMSHPKTDKATQESDILSQPQMYDFLDRATRNRRLLLSPAHLPKLSFDQTDGQGYWAALPVQQLYDDASKESHGLVLGQFDFTDFIDQLLKSRISQIDHLQLVDATLPTSKKVLYQKDWESRADDIDVAVSRFSVAGRVLELSFVPSFSQRYVVLWAGVTVLGVLLTGLILLVRAQHHKHEAELEDAIFNQTQELAQRNQFFNLLMNVTFDGVLALDKDYLITYNNRKSIELISSDQSDCLGQNLVDLIGARAFDKLIFPARHHDFTDKRDFSQIQLIELENTKAMRRLVEFCVVPLMDLEDRYWLILLRDISKQREVEERFRQTDRQFRQAFLLGSVPMGIIDGEGYIQETNRALQQTLNHRSAELYTRHIEEFLHEHDRDPFLDWLDGARRNHFETYQCEQRMISAQGHTLWVMASYTAIYGKTGKLDKIICQYLDYTARKKVERELKLHRDKLEHLVATRTKEAQDARENLIASINAADNAILVYDNENRIEFSSGQVRDFFPEMAAELRPGVSIERLVELQSLRTGEDEGARKRRIARVNAGVSGDEIQLTDGRWIQTRRRKTPSGGTIVVHTDVTSFKDQQELLQKQAEDLALALKRQQELNEQQKIFVSVVSHEFKNPLAIIDSAAQRLLRKKGSLEDKEVQDRLHGMRDAVMRLLKLIENTIAAQRIENQKMQFAPKNMDVSQAVLEICEKQSALVTDHRLVTGQLVPNLLAPIDPELFEIALNNLINNAVKYSPVDSEITISVKAQDRFVCVSVEDQGLGIAKEDIPHIYNRFYRAQGVMDVEGTGLGLSIVKQIVTLHKGEVHCRSEEGEGACFYMLLPQDDKLSG